MSSLSNVSLAGGGVLIFIFIFLYCWGEVIVMKTGRRASQLEEQQQPSTLRKVSGFSILEH